jgi:hypothetical protein
MRKYVVEGGCEEREREKERERKREREELIYVEVMVHLIMVTEKSKICKLMLELNSKPVFHFKPKGFWPQNSLLPRRDQSSCPIQVFPCLV